MSRRGGRVSSEPCRGTLRSPHRGRADGDDDWQGARPSPLGPKGAAGWRGAAASSEGVADVAIRGTATAASDEVIDGAHVRGGVRAGAVVARGVGGRNATFARDGAAGRCAAAVGTEVAPAMAIEGLAAAAGGEVVHDIRR